MSEKPSNVILFSNGFFYSLNGSTGNLVIIFDNHSWQQMLRSQKNMIKNNL
jgi:hypothetical protein